jgi:ribosomal-protein-alanine N-acetyltransferase
MIRAATLDDLGALAALHAASFRDAWSAHSIGRLLATPGAFALIAEANDRALGFVLARVAGGEAEILSLAVVPIARRAGLGRALVLEAALRAGAAGALAAFLEVATANDAARALYGALGFAEVGRRKGYYAGPSGPADALILKAALPLTPLGKAQGVD